MLSDSPQIQFRYQLQLSSEVQWLIGNTQGCAEWTNEFCKVLELSRSVNSASIPKFIFTTDSEQITEHPIFQRSGFPKLTWTNYKYFGSRIWYNNHTFDLFCQITEPETFDDKIYSMWAVVHAVYRRAVQIGGTPLHAAISEQDGKGIVFAAPGGGGKSTTSKRLSENFQLHGDDEVLVLPDDSESFIAHPFPTWSNFLYKRPKVSWKVEKKIPLKAAFFIEKADKEEIIPLKSHEASALFNQSIRQIMMRGWHLSGPDTKSRLIKECFGIAVDLAKSIPAFKIRLTLEGSFEDTLEKVLKEKGIF